jgi:Spy/CpxP family protein refolding chaperone
MKKLGVIIVAAMVLFSVKLYSQPAEGKGFKEFYDKLNLTEQQKKDLEKIRAEMEKKLIMQRANIQTAEVELEQLYKADSPDKTAIEKKLKEIANLEVQLRMLRIDSWFDINKLLTPEQQKTWKKALESRSAMRHKMMDRKMMKDHNMGKGPMHTPEPPSQPAPQPPGEPSPKK